MKNDNLANIVVSKKKGFLKDIKIVLFDLDGTLVDSCRDIALCVNAALEHFDLPQLPLETIKTFVGNGSKALIKKSVSLAFSKLLGQHATLDGIPTGIEKAIHSWYLSYYKNHPAQKSKLYAGVTQMLLGLQKLNIKMGIVSNKPTDIVHSVLRSFAIKSFFCAVVAQEDMTNLKPDKEGILKAVLKISASLAHKEYNIPKALNYDIEIQKALLLLQTDAMTSPTPLSSQKIDFPIVPQNQVLMTGDSPPDIYSGKNYGCLTCAVTNGYTKKQTLLATAPDMSIDNAAQLINYFL